jgi:hypothetical protein
MAYSFFLEKNHLPGEEEIVSVLGDSRSLWETVLQSQPASVREWKFYGKSLGWTLRLKRNGKLLFCLYPNRDEFFAGFVFKDLAVEVAHQAEIPGEVLALIDAAQPYAEGRWFYVPVRNQSDMDVVSRLAEIKQRS